MLAAEGQSIACHKLLLSAASEFFRDKFVTNPDPQNHSLLCIDDMGFDTLAAVVSYIYSDDIDFTGVPIANTIKLILAGVQLKIPELTEKCQKHIFGIMESDVEASIEVHRLAKPNVLKEVREKAWKVMIRNFERVVASKAFLEWSETQLLQYLQEDGLSVENENPVFDAVVAWVKHDIEARKPIFSRLAGCLRLGHCSPAFLKEVVAKEPLMESCYRLLLNVFLAETSPGATHARTGKREYKVKPVLGALTNPAPADPPTETIVILGGTQNGDVKCWILKDGGWDLNKDFAMPVEHLDSFSVCMRGQDAFITGGYTVSVAENKCWKVSFPSMRWRSLQDLTVARYVHASVCVGDGLYVIGGSTAPQRSTADVESFTVNGCSLCPYWPDMPIALPVCSAIHISGTILVCGLRYFDTESNVSHKGKTVPCNNIVSVLSYTIRNKTWAELSYLQYTGSRLSSLVWGNTLYVVDAEERHCMSYRRGVWKVHSAPTESVSGGQAMVWQHKIYLLSCLRNVVRMEEYDPAKDNWSISNTLNQSPPQGIQSLHFAFVMRF